MGSKSGSVERILKAWNVGADSMVFVDDNRIQLEEVRAAFPEMECVVFPKSDYPAGLAMLRRPRDLFGTPLLAEEDAYRPESAKQNRHVADSARNGDMAEHFLATAEASIALEFDTPATDRRVVELVNKTNQFNLKGIRYTEAEWRQGLQDPGSFAAVVSYRDNFGLLGKIAVLRGQRAADRIRFDSWVMSCRAFLRCIEYQCLSQLFQRLEVQEIIFNFISTPNNGPMRDFLSGLAGEPAAPLTRDAFAAKCPKLYQEVTEIVDTIEQVW